jgi:hypothetical protein
MRSPCCLSVYPSMSVCLFVYPSVSVHLSIYTPTSIILEAFEAYDAYSLSFCIPPNFYRRLMRSPCCLCVRFLCGICLI